MQIGELARLGGVNIQTVRYYERRGLLTPARRTASGYREYDSGSAQRLRFIRRAQELGFTLAEVEGLLALRMAHGTTTADVKARATAKIAQVDGKIRDLERIRDALGRLASRCRGDHGPVGECPLLDALGPIGDSPE